jgi:tRNA U34 5-methylaminomethyl-2-thiouridine-forming methyltransferase MnmC
VKRQLQLTKDGSFTIAIPEMNVTYHSHHGALQESQHIYINTGFKHLLNENNIQEIAIFEMGFGTGLNALLTLQEATKLKQKVFYYGIELFPLTLDEAKELNYDQLLLTKNLFIQLNQAAWEKVVSINNYFKLYKTNQSLLNVELHQLFNLIYFDAFAANSQPELWTEAVFKNLYNHLHSGGILVTYSSKGVVRRALQAVGFKVEKLAGPVGKAEIVRAIKL